MQDLMYRFKSCLLSAGLKGVRIDPNYSEKVIENTEEGQVITYTYNVYIPEYLFINKRDNWDVYQVNAKIQKFNEIANQRIKFISHIKMSSVSFGTIDTILIIKFKR